MLYRVCHEGSIRIYQSTLMFLSVWFSHPPPPESSFFSFQAGYYPFISLGIISFNHKIWDKILTNERGSLVSLKERFPFYEEIVAGNWDSSLSHQLPRSGTACFYFWLGLFLVGTVGVHGALMFRYLALCHRLGDTDWVPSFLLALS